MPVCVLTRLWFNFMDGLVERELGLAGAWGEVKNEFGDRVADSAHPLGAVALPRRPLCRPGHFVH